jgi:hypothetical protein
LRLANPPISGYGELARLVLQHPEWPADTRPQPRSLAALLSKLDRGIELEWLADRDAVQHVLALTLGCSLDAIRAELGAHASREGNPARRIRFHDLPYARPFDLSDEPLPPGIPEQAQRPATWDRSYWQAPPGSGRTLTGAWLEARGLATFISAPSWAEAFARVPSSGAVFIEVERDIAGLDPEHLPRTNLCVAAPFPAPASNRARWQRLAPPPLLDVLPELLAWVEARLPEDGAFDHLRALEWLRVPVRDGALPTLGALLGAAGLLDSVGLDKLAGRSLLELARTHANQRLEEAANGGSPEAQWLKRHGFEVVVGLAQRALSESDQPWGVARSMDEWIALVPGEFKQSVDTEWMRWSLARSGGLNTVRQFEQALKDAPPGAYRIVRALVDARLLRPRDTHGGLVIAPELIKHVAAAQAERELLRPGAGLDWGEALLRPHAAPGVIAALFERVQSEDFSLIDALLERDEPDAPALVAALEAAFTCVGLALLAKVEVPIETLEGIWAEQLARLVELRHQLPEPRLGGLDDDTTTSPLLHVDAWRLAALAISERLPDKSGAAHPLLRPWTAARRHAALPRLLAAVHRLLVQLPERELDWARGAFALAGRLEQRGALDELTADEGLGTDVRALRDESAEPSVRALLRPHAIARAVTRATLSWPTVEGLGAHPLELRALETLCEHEHIPWPRMAQTIWLAWSDAGAPESGASLLGPESPNAALFWPHLPVLAFSAVWQRWAGLAPRFPYASFDKPQWGSFVKHWCQELARSTPRWPLVHWRAAFDAIDQGWAAHACDESGLLVRAPADASVLFEVLWRRYPAWLMELVGAALLLANPGGLALLLAAAPPDQSPALVSKLSSGLDKRSGSGSVDAARAWLRRQIVQRRAGWRDAYALLGELELRVSRAERARGLGGA